MICVNQAAGTAFDPLWLQVVKALNIIRRPLAERYRSDIAGLAN